jgi:hypothetical protein
MSVFAGQAQHIIWHTPALYVFGGDHIDNFIMQSG